MTPLTIAVQHVEGNARWQDNVSRIKFWKGLIPADRSITINEHFTQGCFWLTAQRLAAGMHLVAHGALTTDLKALGFDDTESRYCRAPHVVAHSAGDYIGKFNPAMFMGVES